ncbi:uncharacterized protein PV09_06301 [Verruconis gallopava]|uniref:Zn(2)-C6 fungal-type domain-containing protein n=1 Tax=Verruconis gallopava TaxID=253628 RepID=A0A0D1XJN6_9PEZI|nr:uncharacterized protein PV09_06301 [Verruconis gallopava]KIW02501.1 hypothetical protein PV09_06301 [Verruconis gallopava]
MNPTDTKPRNRVRHACQSCRIRKTKCDGHEPCERCKTQDLICSFSTAPKSKIVYPVGLTTMIMEENQTLKAGLREAFRRLVECEFYKNQQNFQVADVKSIHEILKTLNVPLHASDTADNASMSPPDLSQDLSVPSDSGDSPVREVDTMLLDIGHGNESPYEDDGAFVDHPSGLSNFLREQEYGVLDNSYWDLSELGFQSSLPGMQKASTEFCWEF